ncbi:MAG: hypothetical protein HOV87_00090 [Catenulispora sp.]|nr:hypothetical protein [Catenulispora sp.]
MRISRRTSRTTAGPRTGASALRRTTAAGAALTFAVLAAAACSSSKSGGAAQSAQAQQQADANANENDIQILNTLQLTAAELDTAFATDGQWKAWPDYDPASLLIKQAQACTAGIIDTKSQSLNPVTTAYKSDRLPSDPAPPPPTAPSSTPSSSKSSSGKNHTPSAPATSGSTPGSTSGSPTPVLDQNPPHWVVSTAIVYKSADAAHSAVSGMGKIDPNTVGCGGPGDGTAVVGGAMGEVGPSWYGSQGVFVYADTKTNQAVTVVAQRRGRYVVLTYTRGFAQPEPKYYDLEFGPDTNRAADAATGVLKQLTDSIVNRG